MKGDNNSMNIGFVSTWFERGAAYVTKAYIEALKKDNNIFIYARGGEKYGKGDPNWDLPNVTWGLSLTGTNINFRHFKNWIERNNIETLFFNEQHKSEIIIDIKSHFPNLKVGTYIDYYKENTVEEFLLYDFLICNTERHYSVFKDHPQCYYIPWGTDVNLFKPKETNQELLTFFHSAGMSLRKGTKLVVKAFIDGELYKNSKLLIHSQIDFQHAFGLNIDDLKNYNIEVVQKTVTAPGLYYLGDVYVYPTTLDGLGLTLYEALACGLPVITTNNAPMNEVINNKIGRLVEVDQYRSRSDGYYWPLSICNEESLINSMKYYVTNKESLIIAKDQAREDAINKWDWKDRYNDINKVFNDTSIIVKNPLSLNIIFSKSKLEKIKRIISCSYFFHLYNIKRNKN